MAKREQETFRLTKHALLRMRERFPEELREAVDFEPDDGVRLRKMYEFLWNATVENRVIHDTNFMQFVHEKYGYEKTLRFFASGNMLFIGAIHDGQYNIVTVVDRRNYVSRYLRPVEKKLQKKPVVYRKSRPTSANKSTFRMKKREYLEAELGDY